MEEPSEGLEGFTEAHVVGEDTAEIVFREKGEEVKTFFLVGAEVGDEAGREGRCRRGAEGGGAFADLGPEFFGEGVAEGFVGELEGVEAEGLAGGLAGGGRGVEAEAGEFFLRGGGIVEDEAAPAVAGEADEAAAGAVENRQIGGREGGVFGAEGHADVEPIDAGFVVRREIDGEVGAGRG